MHEDLIIAIQQGEVAQVAALLEIEYTLLNQSIEGSGSNVTPLAHAVIHKQPEVVKYLLASGADIYAPLVGNNLTVIQLAEILFNSTDAASRDIKQILKLAQLIREEHLTSNDLQGIRPDIQSFGLILAARYNDVNAVKILLQEKAGFAEVAVAGRTPLEWTNYYIKSSIEESIKKGGEEKPQIQPATTIPEATTKAETKNNENTLATLISEAKAQGRAQEIPAIIRTYHQNNAQRILQQNASKDEKNTKLEQKQAGHNGQEQLQFTDRQYEILSLLQANERRKSLRAAIEQDNLSAVKSLVEQDASLLDIALMLAFDHGRIHAIGYLLQSGADYRLLLAEKVKIAAEMKSIENILRELPSGAVTPQSLQTRGDILRNKLRSLQILDGYSKVTEYCHKIITELYAQTVGDEQYKDDKRSGDQLLLAEQKVAVNLEKNAVNSIINEELTKILTNGDEAKQWAYGELSVQQRIDLNITVASLLKIVAAVATPEQLRQQLKAFLQRRETAIHNTELDYCYAPNFIANQICYRIAEKVFPLPQGSDRSHYNLLLPQTSKDTGEGKEVWKDAFSQEHQLPKNKFIRLNGELLRLDSIITLALKNLQTGRMTLENIWLGSKLTTDGKNFTPLDKKTLLTLRQLSPTLAKLIAYTEELNHYATSNNATQDLLSPLVKLRDDLFKASAADYRLGGNGTHERAGENIYLESIAFANWWNSLSDKIKNRIKNLSVTIRNEDQDKVITLGYTIDKLLLDRKRDERDVEFCAANRAWDINTLLNNAGFRQQLTQISQEEKLGAPPCVTDEQLQYWQQQITHELEARQVNVKFIGQSVLSVAQYSKNICELTAGAWDYDTLEQAAPMLPEGCYDSTSALFVLLESGQINRVKLLLKSEVDLTAHNKDKKTLIELAASNKQWDIVQLIADMKEAASGDDAEKYGVALLYAAVFKQFAICKQLLAINGCSTSRYVNDDNSVYYYPIHYFVFYNQPDLVHEYGKINGDINRQQDESHPTPLTLAARKKDVDLKTFETLLKLKPNLEATENCKTALCHAIESGQLEKAKLLIQHGANLTARGEAAQTLIAAAAIRGQWNIVQMVAEMKKSATGNDEERYGHALLEAAKAQRWQICRQLLAIKGINFTARDCNTGYFPIHHFVLHNQQDLITEYQKAGGGLNHQQSKDLPTPLTLAAKEKNVDIKTFAALLALNPNLEATENGKTALQLSVSCRNFDKAVLLIRHGANFAIKDSENKSFLQYLVAAKEWRAKRGELLKAIFARNDLNRLDLSDCQLDDNDLESIEQELNQNETIIELNLGRNKFTKKGLQTLANVVAKHSLKFQEESCRKQLQANLQSTQATLAQLEQKQLREAKDNASESKAEQKKTPMQLQEFLAKQKLLLSAYKNSVSLLRLPHTAQGIDNRCSDTVEHCAASLLSFNAEGFFGEEKTIPENPLSLILDHWGQIDRDFNPAKTSILHLFSLTPGATIPNKDYQATLILLVDLYLAVASMQRVIDKTMVTKESAFVQALNLAFGREQDPELCARLQAIRKFHQGHLYSYYRNTILNEFRHNNADVAYDLYAKVIDAASIKETLSAVTKCSDSIGIWASLWSENRKIKNYLKNLEAEIKTMEADNCKGLSPV